MFTPTVKRREDPDFPSISQPMQEFLLFCLPVASSKFLLKLVFLLGNFLLKAAVSKWLTLLSRVHFVLCLSSSCRIVLWFSQHSWGTFSATKGLLTRFTLRPVLQSGKSFSNNSHNADAVIYWFKVCFCCSLQLLCLRCCCCDCLLCHFSPPTQLKTTCAWVILGMKFPADVQLEEAQCSEVGALIK